MMPSRSIRTKDAAASILGSPRFSQSLTIAIVTTVYLSFALRSTIGWGGLIGVVVTLVVLAAIVLIIRRDDLEWRGLLPISLFFFLAWSALSVFWSDYQWASLGSILYQQALAFCGIFVAMSRDLIQIVRSFGDVLRGVLAGSIAVEVLSGLIFDMPFQFLGVAGRLAEGGPIQGLMGSRNQLGLVALIALVTFFVEALTRSASRNLSTASMLLAGMMIVLTRSPVTFGVFTVIVIFAVILLSLRRRDPAARRVWQFVVLGSVVTAVAVAVIARSQVIQLLNAGSEFEYRLSLWGAILDYPPSNTLEGFGWIGFWRSDLPPYIGINAVGGPYGSALNAFLDVALQLGVVGLTAFVAFVGLATVRSWLLASNKRSIIYLWVALILIVLMTTSFAESAVLVEFCWLTLVICAVKASEGLSWRVHLPSA